MVTLISPKYPVARKAYRRVTSKQFSHLATASWWGVFICLAAAAVLLSLWLIRPEALAALVALAGIAFSGIAGLAACIGIEYRLQARAKRLVARYRTRGDIIDVPKKFIEMWRNALIAVGVQPDKEPLAKPENHLAFFVGLMRFHDACAEASEQLKPQLVARIQDEINAKAEEVAAVKQDIARLETEMHDTYARRLLAQG